MSCTIYIPSLPSFFDDFSLRQLFNDCGRIKECGVIQHETLLKSSGFVKFTNTHCTKMAAAKKDQTILERSAIRVFVVWDIQETLSTIRVSNLPDDIHANGLKNLFSPFGDVVNVKISKNFENTEADVSFSRVEYAIRATDEMDGAAFGPNNGNLSVKLVNPDARCFKWKRNIFEYISNPWMNQSPSQRSNQKRNKSPPVQRCSQIQTQSNMWESSTSHSDLLTNDNQGNDAQNLTSNGYTTSPTSSILSASSGQSSSSILSSTSNGKNSPQENTTSKKSVSSSTNGGNMQEPSPLTLPNVYFMAPTCPIVNVDMGNRFISENDIVFNNDVFQSLPTMPLKQNQIPFYNIFSIPSLIPSINLQNPLSTNPVFPINASLLPNNSNSCVTNLAPLSNVSKKSTLPQANVLLQEQNISVGSSKKVATTSSQPIDAKTQKKQSVWSKEQEELGNYLHSTLKPQYPLRCEKLVGMLLTENKIKNIKFVMENPKALSEKVAYFNKLLDDIRHP